MIPLRGTERLLERLLLTTKSESLRALAPAIVAGGTLPDRVVDDRELWEWMGLRVVADTALYNAVTLLERLLVDDPAARDLVPRLGVRVDVPAVPGVNWVRLWLRDNLARLRVAAERTAALSPEASPLVPEWLR